MFLICPRGATQAQQLVNEDGDLVFNEDGDPVFASGEGLTGNVLEIPDPQLGDQFITNIKTSLYKTSGGGVFSYLHKPVSKRLSMAFDTLKPAKMDELRTFLKNCSDTEIGLIDHEGVQWRGFIVSHPFESSELKTFDNIALEFEGSFDTELATDQSETVVGYVFGGIDSFSGGNQTIQDTDEYNQLKGTPGVWVSRADIPSPPRRSHGGGSTGTSSYLVGGINDPVSASNLVDNDEYQPVFNSTGNFVAKTDAPSPARRSPVNIGLLGKMYAIGGVDDTSSRMRDNDEFNPTDNTWTAKADIPTPARNTSAGENLNDLIYIFTGDDSGGIIGDTDQYDVSSDIWTSRTDVNSNRSNASSFHLNEDGIDIGYVLAGFSVSDQEEVQRYAPNSDTWTNVTSTPVIHGRGAHPFTIKNVGYIAGGRDGGTIKGDTSEYDFGTDLWVGRADLPSPERVNGASSSSTAGGTTILIDTITALAPVRAFILGGDDSASKLQDNDQYLPDTWTAKADLPSPARRHLASFSVNNQIYACGGFGKAFLRDNDKYNPGDNTWISETDMPEPFKYFFDGTAILGKGYVFGGFGTTDTRDTIEYDPSAKTWIFKQDFPSPDKFGLGATTIENFGYIAGGSTDSGSGGLRDVSKFDAFENSWATQKDIPLPGRHSHAFTEVADKGYFYGGESGFMPTLDAFEYTPDADGGAWLAVNDIPSPARSKLAGSQINQATYAFGGDDSGSFLQDTDEFTPSTGLWVSKTDMISPIRAQMTASGASDFGYNTGTGAALVYGGAGPGQLIQDTDKFDPDTDVWSSKTNMLAPARNQHSAVTLLGKGYVFGGLDVSRSIKSNDQYNPASDAWTQQTSITTSQSGVSRHVSAELNDLGYVIGGSNSGAGLKENNEYDPIADTWTLKNAMLSQGKIQHSAFSTATDIYTTGGIGANTNIESPQHDEFDGTNWVAKTPIPEARFRHSAVSIGGDGYLFGGAKTDDAISDSYKYDVGGDSWSTQVNTLKDITGHSSTSVGSYGYVFGGTSANFGSFLQDTVEFDPATNSWTTKPSMPQPGRVGSASSSFTEDEILLNAYSWGGFDGTSQLKNNDKYFKFGDSWQTKTDIISPSRIQHSAVNIINVGYMWAGDDGANQLLTNEKYDEFLDSWATEIDLPSPEKSSGVAEAVGGFGYAMSGTDGASQLSGNNQFDALNPEWTTKTDVPRPNREDAVSGLIGSNIFVVSGYDGSLLLDNDRYVEPIDGWNARTNLSSTARRAAVGLSLNNKVYVFGGNDGSDMNDVDFYDDTAGGVWTAGAPLPSPVRSEMAGATIEGSGFIFGGVSGGSELQDNDQYIPSADTWQSQTDLTSPARQKHSGISL